MASIRGWKRWSFIYKLVALLVSMYILVNLWSVEVINYEVRNQPESLPDAPGDIQGFNPQKVKDLSQWIGGLRSGQKHQQPADSRDGRLYSKDQRPDSKDQQADSKDQLPDAKDQLPDAKDQQPDSKHVIDQRPKHPDDREENPDEDSDKKRNDKDETRTLKGVGNGAKNKINEGIENINLKGKKPDGDDDDDDVDENDDDERNDKRKGVIPLNLRSNGVKKARPTLAAPPTVDGKDTYGDVGDKADMDTRHAQEPFMALLERDMRTDTFEVDLTKVKHDASVTYPQFVERARPDGPGEGGQSFHFKPGDLTAAEEKQKRKDYDIHYFDVWVSRKISLHRKLYDYREPECFKQTYHFKFPTISVVIVFFNEAWSTLLRSIHSVLDRSPKGAVTEVVLLDDGSNLGHLRAPLERYLQPMKVVRLIRANKRLGLIKARNLGFLAAKGDIIIFLDSHIECADGWLEPLVQPIVRNYKVVTYPIIDGISKTDFGVVSFLGLFIGGLKISNLAFTWINRNLNGSLLYDSPTMPGGLYAISRKWFRHLGAYDPDLHLWGAENIEISLKIWMCGGALLQVRCSHIGHVFRTQSPVTKEHSAEANFRNSIRVAEVWMDRYKHYYYERVAYSIPEHGGVAERRRLREDLKCRSFQWYLNHVNPELKAVLDLDGVYAGMIVHNKSGLCLQASSTEVELGTCTDNFPGQIWILRTSGFLQIYESVIGINKVNHGPLPVVAFNVEAQHPPYIRWKYHSDIQRLQYFNKNRCLDVKGNDGPVLAPCRGGASQQWHLQRREEMQQHYRRQGTKIDWNV